MHTVSNAVAAWLYLHFMDTTMEKRENNHSVHFDATDWSDQPIGSVALSISMQQSVNTTLCCTSIFHIAGIPRRGEIVTW